MFDCDSCITYNTNRRLFFFSKERNVSNKNDQYVVCLESLCLLSLSYKMITVCPEALVKSHEDFWILWQLHPILSAKPDEYIWQSMVLSLKRACKSSIGAFVKSYFSTPSAAAFPRIHTYIHTHTPWSARNPHKNKFLPVYINSM